MKLLYALCGLLLASTAWAMPDMLVDGINTPLCRWQRNQAGRVRACRYLDWHSTTDGTTDEITSHSVDVTTDEAADETSSHSAKPPKIGVQAAGYSHLTIALFCYRPRVLPC